ncbi:Aminomethyltransferase, mitochondrial [Candida viswanathii]|uniref:aminomethyltransferase n=1 Tax=Candida viswanathii TaxID=5486 RepID=A0A367XV46_9ASCO|nr:Aminomethyltransferase, mitochondrial [Candida viswanathii]
MLRLSSKRLYSTASNLVKTPLHQAHIELGGKMVPYAGFEMPVLYNTQSHIDSHNWVRSKVGLFDVSHMLQHKVTGKNAKKLLQKITPIDLDTLPVNTSSLSVLLNNNGGVIDDCIITKHGEEDFYMVTNAGCRARTSQVPGDLTEIHQRRLEQDLFRANQILKSFSYKRPGPLARSGYTGEDGFELSIPSSNPTESKESLDFFRTLINEYPDTVKPIGLAARDSLRLEAGMCLYGHELTEEITPVEASLSWLIPKTRRESNNEFNGASKILGQLKDKSSFTHRRIGLTSKGPAPRENSKLFNEDGTVEIGYVTSGSASPTLGGNVAQAYIDKKYKIGSNVKIEIRGKLRDGTIAKLPFVPSNLYKP